MRLVEEYPHKTYNHGPGVQKIYRASNNYGASVVRHDFSYGSDKGLWEAAIISFPHEDNTPFHIEEQVPIASNSGILGNLTWDEVEELLKKIDNLPPKD